MLLITNLLKSLLAYNTILFIRSVINYIKLGLFKFLKKIIKVKLDKENANLFSIVYCNAKTSI